MIIFIWGLHVKQVPFTDLAQQNKIGIKCVKLVNKIEKVAKTLSACTKYILDQSYWSINCR